MKTGLFEEISVREWKQRRIADKFSIDIAVSYRFDWLSYWVKNNNWVNLQVWEHL